MSKINFYKELRFSFELEFFQGLADKFINEFVHYIGFRKTVIVPMRCKHMTFIR